MRLASKCPSLHRPVQSSQTRVPNGYVSAFSYAERGYQVLKLHVHEALFPSTRFSWIVCVRKRTSQ